MRRRTTRARRVRPTQWLAVAATLAGTCVATPLLASGSGQSAVAPASARVAPGSAASDQAASAGAAPGSAGSAEGSSAAASPGSGASTVSADPGHPEGDGPADDGLLARGEELYERGCASCHGPEGQGIEIRNGAAGGPSLREAGEAGAYYYLSTGRMPLNDASEQPESKDPAYSDEDIDALVAYVASLGDGPALPDVELEDADLAAGGVLYRANCQPCHSASGSGGALSYGRAAPRLSSVEPEQVAAAVRTGPGQMPVFDTATLDRDELDDVIRYIRYLQHPDDPGGLPIGRTGPIPEGFVAWLVGMVALLALVVWIGTRSPVRNRQRAHD